MKPNTKFQVINPPNTLAGKVSSTGGPELDTIVREAEEALVDLQESYTVWVRQDLDMLDRLVSLAATDRIDAPAKLREIHNTAHDIKGQGATFEFPLLTHVASSLCTLLSDNDKCDEKLLALIRLHIDAMNVVIKDNIRGMGGVQGKQLVEMLHTAIGKVMKA